ncbi:methionyl-tRNA formyltransferase [Zeimonas arvi]|uniref:Methionyl-tRNA formyltransferase n=1 Tax=Zeimonas arvi TaxID=2498847 RepID=A0A5C8NU56_9BURK|nr:methionyl-tRNA formyltransferase [Zeimonas arvi]TXL64697.1 methionyl-tRNA formyltransferase [Zeimonas arvi]
MLRIAFAGTPEFAAAALDALAGAGHEIALVLTQPDRPAGRGKALQRSPVKRLALSLGLEVWQPATLRDPEAWRRLAEARLDAMVVAAYGLILPAQVLAIPRLGCLNIHASLLPRWRGAAPIQRAIEAGDTDSGITIMQMDEGLDTGPMLSRVATPIVPEDTGGSLHDRLASLGARAIVDALAGLEAGRLAPEPQPAEGATYARKLGRADAALDFALGARALVDRIRAFDPVPGSVATIERDGPVPVKFWRARAAGGPVGTGQSGAGHQGTPPGTVLRADADGLVIACGDGAIVATELQKPGGKRLACGDFLRGFPIRAGERFVPPATT